METFSALLAICAGNSPVTGEFPAQRPVTRSFDVFFIWTWMNGWVNNGEVPTILVPNIFIHKNAYEFIIKIPVILSLLPVLKPTEFIAMAMTI